MKHLKKFENLSIEEPEIGDYVICQEKISNDPELLNFLSSNVGICANISHVQTYADYVIIYKNIPNHFKKHFPVTIPNIEKYYPNYFPFGRRMRLDEINKTSKNEEELEIYIHQNIYNL